MHLRERVAGIITLVLAGGLMVQALLYVHRRLEPAGAVHCTDQCPEHHRLLLSCHRHVHRHLCRRFRRLCRLCRLCRWLRRSFRTTDLIKSFLKTLHVLSLSCVRGGAREDKPVVRILYAKQKSADKG